MTANLTKALERSAVEIADIVAQGQAVGCGGPPCSTLDTAKLEMGFNTSKVEYENKTNTHSITMLPLK